jgi:hypothetical protein
MLELDEEGEVIVSASLDPMASGTQNLDVQPNGVLESVRNIVMHDRLGGGETQADDEKLEDAELTPLQPMSDDEEADREEVSVGLHFLKTCDRVAFIPLLFSDAAQRDYKRYPWPCFVGHVTTKQRSRQDPHPRILAVHVASAQKVNHHLLMFFLLLPLP